MEYRTFGRLGWPVSAVGYGMWGMAGWTGSADEESHTSLDLAVELGCNFFDTAYAYGRGHSEQLLGALLKRHPARRLYVATKIPPKNGKWPSRPEYPLEQVFPAEHIVKYTERSLQNLGVETIDLQQFHVWDDGWAGHEEWQKAVEHLKREGKVQHFGISVNRWEPTNVVAALRTGLIDAVQVIYNIFDQNPEDELFPLCQQLGVAVIARVPFDEGSLTGTLTHETVFPPDDWRSTYFVPENLHPSVDRAEALKPLVPPGMTLPEMALRFILHHPAVSTIIPGMRKAHHVRQNLACADGQALPAPLLAQLRPHRWERQPTAWSQ
ncbi:MAG: aldo/keto reductase [Bernardetiaceae bacterium]|jgi:aryl-alcohol dehydrogenase-like predicted oxidoreductase|nr:aldo/keto reductase [Bernardetiaceae bacterium]